MAIDLKQNASKGFTLVELLITLTIVLVILHFSITQINHVNEEQTFEQFIDTLQRDVFAMQQYTITTREMLSLHFNNSEHYYVIYKSPLEPELIRRYYDPNIKLNFTTLENPVRFQLSGNIINPGRILATYFNDKYEIIFPLGKGRFYVQKI